MSKVIVIENGTLDPIKTKNNLDAVKRHFEKKLKLPQQVARVFKNTLKAYIKSFVEELKKYKDQLRTDDYSELASWEVEFTSLVGRFS